MSGAWPSWRPIAAATGAYMSDDTTLRVINRALLTTGLSGCTVRSVRFAPTMAAAANVCGLATTTLSDVLSRWIDASSAGSLLLVSVGHDVGTQATSALVETRDASCTASSTPRRVQLVCKVDARVTPRHGCARGTQTRCKQHNAACMTDPADVDQLREAIRKDTLAELVPMLERSTLAAEAALTECTRLEAQCKRAAALAKLEKQAAAADRAAVQRALEQNDKIFAVHKIQMFALRARLSEYESEA